MKQNHFHPSPLREKGQSLVEVALFFPIFIVILAGLVEVSQIVITQNRVSQAARVASRFGANGGANDGMVFVALNSITQTLGAGQESWDMWVVRGTVNSDGSGFETDTWEFNHAYGISNTVDFAAVDEATVRSEVLTELRGSGGDISGLRIVGMYALHDVNSILGLDAMPWLDGLYTVRGMNIMRQTGDRVVVTNGCEAFPITVRESIRSVGPPGGNDPNTSYPDASDFDNPNPPSYGSFIYHVPNVRLRDAREGYIYKVWNGGGNGNFGWLYWNSGLAPSANTLNDGLEWPGNSIDYTDAGNCSLNSCPTPLYPHKVRGYVNPRDTMDLSLNVGDYVLGDTGVVNSSFVRDTLTDHFQQGRHLRLIIWDTFDGSGSNAEYHIVGFAVFKVQGYHLAANENWIVAEFISWDTSCGQTFTSP